MFTLLGYILIFLGFQLLHLNDKIIMSSESQEYLYGQQAFDQGKNFLDNPYHCWYNPEKFFDWSRGWWKKNYEYDKKAKEESRKEIAIEEERILSEQSKRRAEEAAKKAEEKYKKSKKGKLEAAGQGSLFVQENQTMTDTKPQPCPKCGSDTIRGDVYLWWMESWWGPVFMCINCRFIGNQDDWNAIQYIKKEKPRRMQGNPYASYDSVHGEEHDWNDSCGYGKPCQPVEAEECAKREDIEPKKQA